MTPSLLLFRFSLASELIRAAALLALSVGASWAQDGGDRLAEDDTGQLAEQTEHLGTVEARLVAISHATSRCVEIAGAPSAQVPISEEAQSAHFAALRDALGDCTLAVELNPKAGEPLFHLATIAQARARHREAIILYQRAADEGIGPAHTRLGDYYNFAIGPIRANIDRAIDHYRDAVAAEDPAGTATLAFMYRLGRGVPRDSAEMVRLFQMAADQGYHFAQYQLANTLLNGEGIPGEASPDLDIPNARAAVPLFAAAARQGNLQAALDLAQIYARGADGVPADAPSQFRWTDLAATVGFPAAIAARAYLLERGIGTALDSKRAAAEYVRALETGEVDINNLRDAGGGRPPEWESATARAFQVILQERGLYEGPIDGLVGRGTLAGAASL